ncbi:MAG: RNA polymerase sigma factor [Thermoguttaceae bacterium]
MSIEIVPKNDISAGASTAGNREAFAQIVQKYQNLVSAVTFGITGNLQQSEDLAQETFVIAWEKLSELREPEKLSSWLCGIARNLSHNGFASRNTSSEIPAQFQLKNLLLSNRRQTPFEKKKQHCSGPRFVRYQKCTANRC